MFDSVFIPAKVSDPNDTLNRYRVTVSGSLPRWKACIPHASLPLPNIIGRTVFAPYFAVTTMVEKPERSRVGDQPRDAVEQEWEVFVRDATEDPLRHVGSISAPTAEFAYEQATKLFAWYATDIWLCPADAVSRYSTHVLDDSAEPVPVDTGEEGRTYEA